MISASFIGEIYWCYVKPQPRPATFAIFAGCFFWVFYIKPQREVSNCLIASGCFFWVFYIKPQLINN